MRARKGLTGTGRAGARLAYEHGYKRGRRIEREPRVGALAPATAPRLVKASS